MFCPYCGFKLPNGSAYCTKCGTSLIGPTAGQRIVSDENPTSDDAPAADTGAGTPADEAQTVKDMAGSSDMSKETPSDSIPGTVSGNTQDAAPADANYIPRDGSLDMTSDIDPHTAPDGVTGGESEDDMVREISKVLTREADEEVAPPSSPEADIRSAATGDTVQFGEASGTPDDASAVSGDTIRLDDATRPDAAASADDVKSDEDITPPQDDTHETTDGANAAAGAAAMGAGAVAGMMADNAAAEDFDPRFDKGDGYDKYRRAARKRREAAGITDDGEIPPTDDDLSIYESEEKFEDALENAFEDTSEDTPVVASGKKKRKGTLIAAIIIIAAAIVVMVLALAPLTRGGRPFDIFNGGGESTEGTSDASTAASTAKSSEASNTDTSETAAAAVAETTAADTAATQADNNDTLVFDDSQDDGYDGQDSDGGYSDDSQDYDDNGDSYSDDSQDDGYDGGSSGGSGGGNGRNSGSGDSDDSQDGGNGGGDSDSGGDSGNGRDSGDAQDTFGGSSNSFERDTSYTYFWPESNSRYYSESDLYGLSAETIRLIRNEIYARHGYIFTDATLNEYFSGKSWYTPSESSAEHLYYDIFNSYERANVDMIRAYEESLGINYLV